MIILELFRRLVQRSIYPKISPNPSSLHGKLTGKGNLYILGLRSIQLLTPVHTALHTSTGESSFAEETGTAGGREGGDDAVAGLEGPWLVGEGETEGMYCAAELVALHGEERVSDV